MSTPWTQRTGTDNKTASPKKTTIMVTGYSDLVYEAHLLEALANREDVAEIYFVPFSEPNMGYSQFDSHHQAKLDNYALIKEDAKTFPINFNPATKDTPTPPQRGYPSLVDQPLEFNAYPIKRLLQYKGGQPALGDDLQLRLRHHMSTKKPQKFTTDQADLCISGGNDPTIDLAIARRHPDSLDFVNHPETTRIMHAKLSLPLVGQDIKAQHGIDILPPLCRHVSDTQQVKEIMNDQKLDQIILKESDGVAGDSVFRVFRNPKDANQFLVEVPGGSDYHAAPKDQPGDHTMPLEAFKLPSKNMLAMTWLRPEKGDMRVIVAEGNVVGAYMRVPTEGSWLANCAQQGKVQPINLQRDISPENLARIATFAKQFHQSFGSGMVAADFLEGDDGKRYLSEVNLGLTDGLVRLHTFGDTQSSARAADALMNAHHQRKEQAVTSRRGA